MMEIRNFQVTLTGTQPIAFENPNATPSGKQKIKDYRQWEEDHWMDRLYRNTDGKVILPYAAIKKCCVDVCSLLDIKPGVGMLKSFAPLIWDCWHIDGLGAPLEFDDKQLVQWGRMVNGNPTSRKGGVGVWRISPQINGDVEGGFYTQNTPRLFQYENSRRNTQRRVPVQGCRRGQEDHRLRTGGS